MASAVTQSPTPPAEAQEQDRLLNVLAWLEIHRKHLLAGFIALICVFAVVYLWRHFEAEKESAGNAALLQLRAKPGQPETAPKAAEYLKVAEEHASTSAGPRARLMAAAAYFTDSQYAEAQAEFARVLEADRNGVLAAQAAYGVAACLDALDKTDEAAAKYQEVISSFPEDSVATQARLSLARLHESRKQPESALRLYDEVLKDKESNVFVQLANQGREELVRKHPELAGTNAVPASVPAK